MLKISMPTIGPEEIAAIADVLQSGHIAQGPRVAEFEKIFADYCDLRCAVAVNSGTAALHAALHACGVQSGDEVITTPFSFVATANAILMQGATPIFADIDPDSFNVVPRRIEEKITEKTKAIVPVHLFGQICDVEAICAIARDHDLKIIEDACQAHGARSNGRAAGTFGDAGCFSFYATKNMTTGEGGIVVSHDEIVAESVRRFRHHGMNADRQYRFCELGFNYRMTDMEAALGLAQLQKVEGFNQKRISNAARLTAGLHDIEGILTPGVAETGGHVFHQYTIRVTNDFALTRDELMECLMEKGIESAIFYPEPLHLCPHIRKLGYKEGDFPIAERMSKEVLSLPIHPLIRARDIDFIIEAFENIRSA